MVEKIYSVKEINSEIKKIFSTFFFNLLIEGEISAIKFHNTGNVYLTLKDDEAVLDCVIFNNFLKKEYQELKEGNKILARGSLSLNIKSGRYSFNIRELQKKGKGELYEKFIQLKEKLEKAGLFDPIHKKKIPFLPNKIGIITAPEGAAIKDILTVTKRRFPGIDIILFPAKVQGEDSVESILTAIKAAVKYQAVDVLIIGRGGGGYEELAVFNDERIAYAVFKCTIPVISAVGHEQDITILDFVADRRAATPSQAAEIVVPDRSEILSSLEHMNKRLMLNLESKIKFYAILLERGNPEIFKQLLQEKIENHYQTLDSVKEKLELIMARNLLEKKNSLELFYASLEKLNPLYLLQKNYSIVYAKDNKCINSISQVEVGDIIDVRVLDGMIKAMVKEKN